MHRPRNFLARTGPTCVFLSQTCSPSTCIMYMCEAATHGDSATTQSRAPLIKSDTAQAHPTWSFPLEMLSAPGRLKRPKPVAQKRGVLSSTHLSRSKNFRTWPRVGASQAGNLVRLRLTRTVPR